MNLGATAVAARAEEKRRVWKQGEAEGVGEGSWEEKKDLERRWEAEAEAAASCKEAMAEEETCEVWLWRIAAEILQSLAMSI